MSLKRNVFNRKINMNTVCNATIFIFILSTYAIRSISLFVEVIFIGTLFLYFLTKGMKLSIYTLWSIMFLGIALLSNLWTWAPSSSFLGTRAVLEVVIIGNLLIAFIDTRGKIQYLLKCFVVAGVGLVLRVSFMFPNQTWGVDRIGEGDYNPNAIGLYLVISALCIAQLMTKKNRKLCIVLILLFSIVIVLTGSRKAFLFLLIGGAYQYYLKSGRGLKKIFIIPVVITILIISYQVIMTVPSFYNVLGYRFEGLIASASGAGTVDASTRVRVILIDKGIELYTNKPYLGYGIASYGQVSGLGIYSHNNYIELLVGVGLIGTLIYYSIYFFSIINLLKLRKDYIGSVFLVCLVLLPVMEYGLVSYFDQIYQIIIACSIAVIRIQKNDKKNLAKISQ